VVTWLRKRNSEDNAAEDDHGNAAQAARMVCHLMKYGAAYVKHTGDATRREKRLKPGPKGMGYELVKKEPPHAK
jgi:hypothetical protein